MEEQGSSRRSKVEAGSGVAPERSKSDWRKVVVDVKVMSSDQMNEVFKEKDEKYRVWATSETCGRKKSQRM